MRTRVVLLASVPGPLAGQPLSALVSALDTENAYVSVHTTQLPGGEVRGNIR